MTKAIDRNSSSPDWTVAESKEKLEVELEMTIKVQTMCYNDPTKTERCESLMTS